MSDRKIVDFIPGKPVKYEERRKRPDWVVRSSTIIAAIGWVLAFIALLFIDRASPHEENFITRYLNIRIVSFWDTTLLRGAFAMILASFAASIIGLILNATRSRRKTDRYNKLLIAISVASTGLLVFFVVSFYSYL